MSDTVRKLFTARAGLPAAAAFFLCLLIFAGFLRLFAISLNDVSIRHGTAAQPQAARLPYRSDFGEQPDLVFIGFSIKKGPLSSGRIHVYPDDCVRDFKIDGLSVIAGLGERTLCRYGEGFDLDLSRYLTGGSHTAELTLENRGGPAAISFAAGNSQVLLSFGGILGALLAAVLLYRLCRILGFNRPLAALAAAGLVLRLVYLVYTGPAARTYDVYEKGGHFFFIRYLLDHYSLPHPAQGWEFHQPPLYYAAAALLSGLSGIANTNYYEFYLQILSVSANMVCLVFGILCFKQVLTSRTAVLLASALFVFWPSGIMNAVRIGNDNALFAFYSISFYYLLCWYKNPASKGVWAAVFWACCAVVTKTNGLVAASLVCIIYLLRAPRVLPRPVVIKYCALLPLVFSAAFMLERTDDLYYFIHGRTADWLLGNSIVHMDPRLRVDGSLPNYLSFDYKTFVKVPFINSRDDNTGRQFFWNYFLKTSLFGEFRFGDRSMSAIASGLSMALLALLAIAFLTFCIFRVSDLRRHGLLLLNICLCFFAIVYLRVRFPASSFTDFRLAYPMLISFAALLGIALEKAEKRGRYRAAFITLVGIGFVLLSIAFFLTPLAYLISGTHPAFASTFF